MLGGHALNVAGLTNTGHVKVGAGSALTSMGPIESTGTLDNDGILLARATAETRAAVMSRLEAQIVTARDGAEGRWTGKGITSSAAAANPLTGLAAVPNDDRAGQPLITTNLGFVTPGINDLIVLHRYNGDANLDGRINSDDYFRIDSGFLAQPQSPTYRDGDFNYDGKINSDDYFLIDSAFLGQGAPLMGVAGSAALAAVAVPEPSSLLLGALMGGLLRRRRSRI